MKKISIIGIILIMFSTLMSNISGKFCEKERQILLNGVFNYENIVFAGRWKEVDGVQQWLVWSFQIKEYQLFPKGKEMSINEVFPGIPFFKAGFGLTLNCEPKETKCQSYNNLVFIFFQTKYKVFRFENEVFVPEENSSNIPFKIKADGETKDWFSKSNEKLDDFKAIMFQNDNNNPKIFVVSKDSLFVSPVTLIRNKFHWTELSKSQDLSKSSGGFVVGFHLYINKIESTDNFLLKYDIIGQQLSKVSVWKIFLCDQPLKAISRNSDNNKTDEEYNGIRAVGNATEEDDNLAIILLISILVAIALVDLTVGAFWLSIYSKNKSY